VAEVRPEGAPRRFVEATERCRLQGGAGQQVVPHEHLADGPWREAGIAGIGDGHGHPLPQGVQDTHFLCELRDTSRIAWEAEDDPVIDHDDVVILTMLDPADGTHGQLCTPRQEWLGLAAFR